MSKTKQETIDEETGEITENLAAETMAGDLRDVLLEFYKTEKDPKPWKTMTEAQQRDLIARINGRVTYAIKRAVKIIAADGRQVVTGNLEQITVKDGLKCVVTLPRHSEQRHAIVDATGQTVLMIVCDDAKYKGEKNPADTDKDQPDLPVADKGKNTPQKAA